MPPPTRSVPVRTASAGRFVEPAGSVSVEQLSAGHRGCVYYVAVDTAYRGQGLGAEIMAGAEQWLARTAR